MLVLLLLLPVIILLVYLLNTSLNLRAKMQTLAPLLCDANSWEIKSDWNGDNSRWWIIGSWNGQKIRYSPLLGSTDYSMLILNYPVKSEYQIENKWQVKNCPPSLQEAIEKLTQTNNFGFGSLYSRSANHGIINNLMYRTIFGSDTTGLLLSKQLDAFNPDAVKQELNLLLELARKDS